MAYGHNTNSIYLDFAKVFDKVDHRLLLEKLKLYGLPQEVVMNGRHSYIEKIISGVPQGPRDRFRRSIVYSFLQRYETMCKKFTMRFFADDTRIMKEISYINDTAMLQQDLNNELHWSLQNNML